MNFKGKAKRLDDIDLPRIGAKIGVGEDELHMVLDVETRGGGFDSQGRPKMLFEPHIFWRELGPGKRRDQAAAEGLAYPKWKRNYPKDSYPRLEQAMKIDLIAALKSASWGLGQVMGFNHKLAGYQSAKTMVEDFLDDEENHLSAMVEFIVSAGLDDELRELAKLTRPTTPNDTIPFVMGYNGKGFRENDYHTEAAKAHNKWRRIRDTPYSPGKEPHRPPVDPDTPPSPKPPTKAPAAKTGGFWAAVLAFFGRKST